MLGTIAAVAAAVVAAAVFGAAFYDMELRDRKGSR